MKKITIEFDNEAVALHFAHWLCGSGEQHYWNWMEYREQEEDGDITAVNFHYHAKEDGEFMNDWTIRTTAGRLG
jgi:hypothetical protein